MAVGTITDDLAYLVRQLEGLHGLTPARVELSIEDGQVTAQIMADRMPRPLVGVGTDAAKALRELVIATEAAIRQAQRRHPRARRSRA